METETIQLRTKIDVPEPVLRTTTISLDALYDKGFHGLLAAIDLYEFAQDSSFALPTASRELLVGIGLLDSVGRLHDVTRDIVLASFEGMGANVHRVNPLAELVN